MRRVPACNVMTRNAVIQIRIDPATRDRCRGSLTATVTEVLQRSPERVPVRHSGRPRAGKATREETGENDGTDGLGEGRRPRRRPAAPAPGMEGSLRRQSRKSSGYRNL